MKVLLVEDDVEKSERIAEVLVGEFSGITIETVRSFTSGLRAAIAGNGTCDLMLLDMSMPNYDVTVQDPSEGVPENLAGKDLLAQMKLRGIRIPTIVITMYGSFGKGSDKTSLVELEASLAKTYPSIFKGLVYYNLAQEGWRSALLKAIKKVVTVD